jgi:exosome complex RNA-binding protein Rrp42 (RNase PH superfamily)
MAVWVALQQCRLPKLTGVQAQAGFADDFHLDSSVEAAQPLAVDHLPVGLSFVELGGNFVLDATQHEESCSGGRVAVAINTSGQYCGVVQGGGLVALSPHQLEQVFAAALAAAPGVFHGLNEALKTQAAGRDSACPDVPYAARGFLG